MTEDFFEPLPEPPPVEPYVAPVWFTPPADELATLVPARQLLARTERGVVLLLSHIDAFREGCSFRIQVSAHRREATDESEWHEIYEAAMNGTVSRHGWSGGGIADDVLRFGVQLPDGRKVTTLGGPAFPDHHDQEPDGPVLTGHGGGGGGGDRLATSSWSLWLWPLSPAEPFDFVVAWPALGIDLTRVELSGRDIVEAASRAGPMWPDTAAEPDTCASRSRRGPRTRGEQPHGATGSGDIARVLLLAPTGAGSTAVEQQDRSRRLGEHRRTAFGYRIARRRSLSGTR